MLIGQYKSKLTDKNRLAVPSKIRAELGDEIIVSKWYEGSLIVVSKASWQNLIERLVGKSRHITSRIRDIDRFVLGSAYEIELDSQGRFVLPISLCEYAKISAEVVFVGLGDRAEVWSLETWSELETKAESKASEALEKFEQQNDK